MSLALVWMLLVPFDPILFVVQGIAVALGAIFGYAVMLRQALEGLGQSRFALEDPAAFVHIVERLADASFDSRFEQDPSIVMHLGTLRLYRSCTFWVLASGCGHLFFYELVHQAGFPLLLMAVQTALTSFPLGMALRKWRIERALGIAR